MWAAVVAGWRWSSASWTSYVRARAESLGFAAHGGLAARADRLLVILAGALLAGFGVPYVLEIAMVVPGRRPA